MILYVCEPEKNTKCSKTFCQEFCKATAFEEYAKRDEHGAPIIATESDRVPQIKINHEVFEKCEEETETITVSKGCLKARKGRFVIYDVEFLKRHIENEAKIYGQPTRPTGRWIEKEDYNLDTYYECSECGADYCIEGDILIHKYCPNCGARMAESEDKE